MTNLTFAERAAGSCDCGPQFECLSSQKKYIGVWRYEDNHGTFYSLEIDEVKEHVWLEDGATRDKEVRATQHFATFAEAMTAAHAAIDEFTIDTPV